MLLIQIKTGFIIGFSVKNEKSVKGRTQYQTFPLFPNTLTHTNHIQVFSPVGPTINQ